MLYLTYRPKTLQEVDNTRAREALTKILQTKHLPHAFLFIGQKGTGKTSAARIFAKAVNCLNNAFAKKSDSIEPCNKCDNCARIDAGSSADVTELDAASNRGIEEIKNLIRESSFAPMTGRYRVFIIDEAHMITTEGFNALLKTLEEPPPSVIFILATTNEEKVPKTIQSRCFKVIFGKAQREDIIHQIKRIVAHEKLTIDPQTIELVALHSDNSFRDAAKLLEELIIQHKLKPDEAAQYMGVRSKDNLLKIMRDQPVAKTLAWIEEFGATGGSFKTLVEDLLEKLRLQLLIKNGMTIEDETDYKYSLKEIMYLMKLFSEAYNLMRMTPIEALPLEMAVVEFYNKKTS